MTATLINKTRYFPKLDSTNLEALRCIKMKKQCPQLIIAQEQSQGRGQYGRIWFAPKGNLYISYIETIQHPIQQQPLIAGVAAACTLKKFIKTGHITLKYPNDVLVDSRKICGILIDCFDPYYVVGVGINVASSPLIQHYETTCLHRYAPYASVGIIARTFLKQYLTWSNKSFKEVRHKWLELSDQKNILTADGFPVEKHNSATE